LIAEPLDGSGFGVVHFFENLLRFLDANLLQRLSQIHIKDRPGLSSLGGPLVSSETELAKSYKHKYTINL
jgi:hypothetical protein